MCVNEQKKKWKIPKLKSFKKKRNMFGKPRSRLNLKKQKIHKPYNVRICTVILQFQLGPGCKKCMVDIHNI